MTKSKRSAVIAYHETTTPGAYVKSEVFHHTGKGHTLMVTPVNVEMTSTGFWSEAFMVFEWKKATVSAESRFNAKALAKLADPARYVDDPWYKGAVAEMAAKKGWVLTGKVLSEAAVKETALEALFDSEVEKVKALNA